MEKLSLEKRRLIIWLYLNGMSFDKISREAKVTKAAVGFFILKLKIGQSPEFNGLFQQIKPLRKLALEFKQWR